MRIKEEFKESGEFWLPSVPDKRILGILSISDGRDIELEVTAGWLKDSSGAFNVNLRRIVGYIQKGRSIPFIPVTLDDCTYKTLPTLGGNSKSLIRVSRAFTGVQYDEGEVPSFNTLTFSIEGIDDWVEVSSIKVEEQRERRTMTISYEPPENVSFNLTNGMQLTIIFDVRHTSSLIPREERIVQKTYFKLVSQEAHELDQFISVARKITEFLCFAINETVCLDNMWATSDDLREDIGGGETSPIRINIYYPSWPYSKDEPKIAWYDMLFKFKEIQNDAERIINNWIDAYEQIAPAFNLYFLAKMGAQTYLEERFSTLVQGLEAYHRRTSNEKQMAEVDFEELIENLMEHCPGEKKEWLRGKLRYGNEVSLRKRIKKLIEPFKYLFGNKEKRKKLANRIVDTRNYLTHYDLSLESKTAKGKDLWTLCLKMELLLELHILQLVGFSEEKIDSIVDNCPKLKRKCTL